nr:helicase-exonuclease AddAB subunit AddA [Butyrivibrio sp.]
CDRAVKEICRLTLEFKERFDERKRQEQVIDFSDMEHFALQILLNHPDEKTCEGLTAEEISQLCTPSMVALEYREFFKEVLIDEYQDSNNVQEMILKAVANDDVTISDRFMVGDVKQSIYKFRLARPELFMEKFHSYDKTLGAHDRRIDLHKNFRSRKEVLEITNYIFRRIMGADLGKVDYDKDAELVTGRECEEAAFDVTPEFILIDEASMGLNPDQQDSENGDGADTSSSSDDGKDSSFGGDDEDRADDAYDPEEMNSREREALVIAQRIKQLMQEDKSLRYKDIVVLLRSAAGWDDVFKGIFAEQGIPSYSEAKSGYFNAWEVAVLLDLLSVTDNPRQDIPLVSVMRSYIGGFTDEELSVLRIAADGDEAASCADSFYGAIELLGDRVPEQVREKTQRFMDFLKEIRVMATYTPVHELLQYIIDETEFESIVTAMPGGGQRRANIELLLANAASYEKSSFKGLFHFVRYIEHLKVVSVDYGEAGTIDENADVVRLMTIHKSKGLEFPVVFVAGMSKRFNQMDLKGDLIVDMDLGLGVKCVNSDLRVKYDTLKRFVISERMRTDSLGEELRVLYVALTRARDKLIMTASVTNLQKRVLKELMGRSRSEGELLPYSLRSGAMSYFDLVLPALLSHPAMGQVFEDYPEIAEMVKPAFDEGADLPALKVSCIKGTDIRQGLISEDVGGNLRCEEVRAALFDKSSDYFDSELEERLKVKFSSEYAYENLKGLFTKTTVTELKKKLLEEDGEFSVNVPDYAAGEETQPKEKAADSGTLTGADRGTAYHRVMELLDDSIYGDEALMEGVRSDPSPVCKELRKWIQSQIDVGKIPEEYYKAVYTPDIATFLATDLGSRMGIAFRSGNLYREKPFMMGIPASELKPEFPENEMVLIQGIVDAWFIEKGDIVLLDYKTDRVKEASELIKRYSIQLDYYKKALEAATGLKVKEVFIYSFALGQEISLNES